MTATPSLPQLVNTPAVLIVRDGWGESPHRERDATNAVRLARTPTDARLVREFPRTLIATSGEDVGLPVGPDGPVMGNSEVGHQNIGAGRIVDQELMRITTAIRHGELDSHPVLAAALEHVARTGGNLHLLGLVSDGQVHSDLGHLFALVDFAAAKEKTGALAPNRLFIHAITDGRDTPPAYAPRYLGALEEHLAARGVGRIATVMGRFYAMDRDHRWDRVHAAFAALTQPCERRSDSAITAVESYYAAPSDASRASDEFVLPTQIGSAEQIARSRITNGDAVVFFNFRGDRPRELSKAFVLDDAAWHAFAHGAFDRGARKEQLFFATLAEYEKGLPVEVIFRRPPKMDHILGAWLAQHGVAQFRCAETEKFPHVTFFFNDYREEPFAGESRTIVPSPKEVATYDLKPEMSAEGVCLAVLARLHSAECEPVLIVNFANADMVGHTGSLSAATRAVEVVDGCVGRIIDAVLARGGSAIVTADHGNAEEMWNVAANCPHTAHTNYTVPCSVVGGAFKGRSLRSDGRLADLAPTLLDMIGLAKPVEMTGKSLLV